MDPVIVSAKRKITLSTGVMYGYGMIYLPSASAMDVPCPQLTSAERQTRLEGDWGRAGVGSFPGRKLAGCFGQSEIAIGPRENAFLGPRCVSQRAWKSIASREVSR